MASDDKGDPREQIMRVEASRPATVDAGPGARAHRIYTSTREAGPQDHPFPVTNFTNMFIGITSSGDNLSVDRTSYLFNMALDFVAGCIGGCAGIIAGHPLDTLKVHVQSGRGSALECTKALLKGGTLTTMYRGVGAPLGGVAAVNAIVFGAYGNTRRALPNPDSLKTHATAGAAAGLMQSFACAPVELVKTRQQLSAPGDGMPGGAWAGARHILRTGGFRALFRGLTITAARDCPAFAIYFTSYEAMTRDDCSVTTVFMAGGVAGMLSWALLYPIDVVKSRIQGDIAGRYAGAWDCFKQSVRSEGWRCMGRGLGAVTLRAFISNGACFTAVAWTERVWQEQALCVDPAGPGPAVQALVQSAVIAEAACHESADY